MKKEPSRKNDPSMPLSTRTIRNSVYNVTGWVWSIGLSFVFTPYIVRRLGVDAYGILALVGAVLGYFAFLDLGLGAATIKYVSEYYGKKEYPVITKVVSSALVAYSLLGLVGCAALLAITSVLVTSILKMPVDIISLAKFAFYLASVGFLVNMVLGVFGSIPAALQRYDISNKVSIAMGSTTTLVTAGLLALGFWLREVVILNLSISIVTVVIYMAIMKKLLPGTKLRFAFDRAIFRKLLKFGVFMTFNRLSATVTYRIDHLLLGILLGTASVGFYAIPFNLMRRFQSVIHRLSEVMFPVASELSATNQIDRLKRGYFSTAKIVVALNSVVFLPLIILAKKTLHFWMGSEFALQGGLAMVYLGMAYFLISFSMIPSLIVNGMGRPKVTAGFAGLTAGINLALIFPLTKWMGISGAALATFVSVLHVPIDVWYMNKRVIKVSNAEFLLKAYSRPMMATVISALAIHLFLGRLVNNLLTLALVICGSMLLCLLAALLTGVFGPEERRAFSGYVRTVFPGRPVLLRSLSSRFSNSRK